MEDAEPGRGGLPRCHWSASRRRARYSNYEPAPACRCDRGQIRAERAGRGRDASPGWPHGQVIEGTATPGGGCRAEQLTLPGFHHDLCSAVHPLAVASPWI